jgi:Flavin containing amine oxidoreductase
MSVEDIPFIDVAIVGGGVSGAYTAFRLLGAPSGQSKQLRDWAEARGGRLSVALFEMSDRIGGRLLSARPPGAPNVVCELGGMRYMSTQTLVKSLVENELRLHTTPQIVDEPQNLVYLRGRHLRQRDLTDSALLPYNLPWNERGRQPADLLGFALAQIIPGVATAKPSELRDLLNSFELDGKPLYQHGFWNVVARALSREGYALSTATVGYDSLGANGNAVDQTFEYFDFTPGTQYNLLTDGYEQVPWELCERARELGCRVEFNANLALFDKIDLPDGSHGVRLIFRDGRKIDARAIVLAMPQRSLRLLEPKGPVLYPDDPPGRKVQSLIDSVFPVALFKMFLAYPFPWWEAQGVTEGRSLTDLMVRQCYYWAVEHGAGADHNHRHALLMAYDDQSNVQFWGGLRNLPLDHPGDHAPATPLFHTKLDAFTRTTEKDDEDENWRLNKAPEIMVEEMHRQIMELHGVTYAPDPYAAAYRDWSDDPFGGGVHFWKIGYRSTETMKLMTQPRPDFPCYVCGEAYSQGQTWVEGALQTAEIVLQSHFGLKPPPWLE